jgi:hypothetical protein
MDSFLYIHSSISGHAHDNTLIFRFEVENMAPDTVHVFDSPRMPYVILQPDGSLLVLQGVNAPDPNTDYVLIEIPVTKAIALGERWAQEVSLSPVVLADYYGKVRTATFLHGRMYVHCHVAWGRTPILDSDRSRFSVNKLLEWQHWAQAASIEVDFG